eukprot:gene7993-8852_t
MVEEERKLKILCFGDSLTEGWYMNGRRFHPYSTKLQQIFLQKNKNMKVEIISKGISGECVYPEMINRLPKVLGNSDFGLVIILGGTNDLACLSKAKSIDLFQQIKNLHEVAHACGAKTCAMTIPQTSFDMLPLYERTMNYREEINNKIREFAIHNKDTVALCDISIKLPMFGINNSDLQKYWDDDLHFTPLGYDKMAELIYESIDGFY